MPETTNAKAKGTVRHRRVMLALLIATAAFLLDAGLYEPRHIQLETYEVALPGLPKSLDGLRVVQLSDIHRSILTSDTAIKRAVAAANDARPDVVVITGDFVSSNLKNAEPCADILSHLKSRLGSYAVLGNHDYIVGAKAVSDALESRGIKLLVNSNVKLLDKFCLIGIDDFDGGKPDAALAMRGVDPRAACLFLSHNPIAARLFNKNAGILLSGHTHGNQLRLPFIPRDWYPKNVDGKYLYGWYRDGKLATYVNRGIGVTNLPLRFFCHPEVTLLVLRSADGRANLAPVHR